MDLGSSEEGDAWVVTWPGQVVVSKNQVEEIDKATLKFISIQTTLFTSLSPDPV